MSSYNDVHNLLIDWIENDIWKFDGSYSKRKYTCLDKFIVKFFNCEKPKTGIRDRVTRLNRLILAGEVDVEWLFGPNGYALFRTKLAQREGDRGY